MLRIAIVCNNPMNLYLYVICFSLIGGLISLLGAVILLTSQRLQPHLHHMLSFAAGALLATTFLELLPEATELLAERGTHTDGLFAWTLTGFVLFFLMESFFHGRATHPSNDVIESGGGHHDLSHAPWFVIIGDTLHNFVDGIAIAAAFIVNPGLGIVTTFAVAAHEIPQEIGDMSVMLAAGWKKSRVIGWNIVSAAASLLGAILTVSLQAFVEPYIAALLALTAGFFIYISAADLVPELHRRTRQDKLGHVVTMFLIGIAVIAIVTKVAHG